MTALRSFSPALVVLASLATAGCGYYHDPDDTKQIATLQRQLADANMRADNLAGQVQVLQANLAYQGTLSEEGLQTQRQIAAASFRAAQAQEDAADAQRQQAQALQSQQLSQGLWHKF